MGNGPNDDWSWWVMVLMMTGPSVCKVLMGSGHSGNSSGPSGFLS